MDEQRPTVTIYTDGGASPNPGPGGWGAILRAENGAEKELSGAEPETTNNRMELTAALEALRALKRPCTVRLVTDSEYLQKGITEWLPAWVAKGWQRGKKPVPNAELWQALHAEAQRHVIEWEWIKGHAGHADNERADRLATAARERLIREMGGAAPLPPVEVEIGLRVSVPKVGGRGGYAFRIVHNADAEQQPIVRTGTEAETNSYRLELVAALEALRAVEPGASVRVHCPSDTLPRGMTQWVPGWQRRGWKTQSGEPVKHQDLWQALAAEASQRQVDWVREADEAASISEGLDRLAREAARGEG